jgi:FkbM family methyltransferase
MHIHTSPTGVKYKIHDRVDVLYQAIQEQACFDPHMIDISIEHLITRPGVVVDVGANIGAYCLEIAVRFPECKIYAFDPVVPTSKELEGNIALNGFTNIESYRIGLGNKECEIEAEDPDVTGSYGCVTLTNKVQHILCQKTAIYKIRTLDSFNLSDVSLIKIDVEGMELEVIEGAVDTINRCSPMLIFEAWRTDWFAEHRTKVMQFVESLGYSLTVMNDDIIAVKQ